MARPRRRKRAQAQAEGGTGPAPGVRSLTVDGGFGGYSGGFTGSFALPTAAGPTVTEHTSQTISAFFNGINIYANAISQIRFHVSRHLPRGGTEPARDNPLYDLLSFQPNDEITSFRYRQSGTGHLFTQGNWYSEIERKRGIPSALHLLSPGNVRPERDEAGRLRYHLLREDRYLPARDVVHVAGMGWDGIRGYSPVSLFRETLGLAIAEQAHTASLMGNNATPTGHLEYPGKLPDKAKGTLRDNWNKVHQGPDRSGNMAILDGGLKWVNESFSPADTELILSRKFSIAEIARILNIPLHMLKIFEGATFSNIEQLAIEFVRLSLMPWLANIEQEFSKKLLTPEDRRLYLIHFDVADLLKGDTAAQIALQRFLFDVGAATPNDVAIYFGKNPIDEPNADKHYIGINNKAALEDLDKVLPQAPGKPEAAPEPAPEPTPEPRADPAVDAVRRLLLDALGRMVRHECEALRRAARKDRLDLWADEFYPRHRAKVIEAVGPCVDALGYMLRRTFDTPALVEAMESDSRRQLRDLFTAIEPAALPEAIARRCSDWEADRPSAFVDALMRANP